MTTDNQRLRELSESYANLKPTKNPWPEDSDYDIRAGALRTEAAQWLARIERLEEALDWAKEYLAGISETGAIADIQRIARAALTSTGGKP